MEGGAERLEMGRESRQGYGGESDWAEGREGSIFSSRRARQGREGTLGFGDELAETCDVTWPFLGAARESAGLDVTRRVPACQGCVRVCVHT